MKIMQSSLNLITLFYDEMSQIEHLALWTFSILNNFLSRKKFFKYPYQKVINT